MHELARFLDSPLPLHRAGKDLDDSWSGSLGQRLSGIWGAQSGSLRLRLADVWPHRGDGREGGGEKGGEAAAATPAARLRRAAPADCLPVGSGIFGLSDEIRIQDVQVSRISVVGRSDTKTCLRSASAPRPPAHAQYLLV